MDYKQKYLDLKQQLLSDRQYGSGKLNPKFINELPDLSFVVNDHVLGDDVRLVIYSLIDEFNKLAYGKLTHNVEISQYYSVDKKLFTRDGDTECENCEVVLKYIDATVCLTENKLSKNSSDCKLGRGIVRFYLKQKNGDCYKYSRIKVV